MKSVERFFVAFCLVGTLARLLVKPYDPLLQVIGFCGLAAFYALAFFFLLSGTSRQARTVAATGWPEVLSGILTGLVSGYAVLSMLLHWLGWTYWEDALMLAGGGLCLTAFAAALLRRHRRAKAFYRQMLLRITLLLAALLLILILKPLLFPGRVLNYLNPA